MTLRYIIGLVVLCACASPLRVYTDYDPDSDLWQYARYDLGDHNDQRECVERIDSVYAGVLRSAVNRELSKRGYTVDHQNPDVVLRSYIVTDDRTVVSPELAGYFYGPFWMRAHHRKYVNKEQTIIVDMLDCNKHHIVWKGWTVTTLHTTRKERTMGKIITKSVAIMFKDFPHASARPAIVKSRANRKTNPSIR